MKTAEVSRPEDSGVPFVTTHATRNEWLAVFSLWFVLNFMPLPFYLQEVPNVAWWQLSVVLVEDAVMWVGLTVLLFHIFDRTPFASRKRIRNGLIRVAVVLGVAYLQAEVIWALGNRTAALLGVPQASLEPPYFDRAGLYTDAATFVVIAMGAHAWLRKEIQTRLASQRANALQLQLSSARLHALSTELQPHFLFNTMNGIAALIPEDPERAEAMLLHLSDLLRYSLEGGGVEGVPLKKELERLDTYLAIQHMRLGDRLDVRRAVDSDTLTATVPSLILQPLVENAIRHGIEPRQGPGAITVRATRVDGRVRVDVEDDGRGFDPEQSREGVGVSNTRSRIETMFPTGSFALLSNAGSGVTARLDFPFQPFEHSTEGDS